MLAFDEHSVSVFKEFMSVFAYRRRPVQTALTPETN